MPERLGFSRDDRATAVAGAGSLALARALEGLVAVTALVSPYRSDRDEVRARHHEQGITFVEVLMDTPVEVCIERDPKDLYKRALAGELAHMTGIDDPFEPPLAPELRFDPTHAPEAVAAEIVEALIRRGIA